MQLLQPEKVHAQEAQKSFQHRGWNFLDAPEEVNLFFGVNLILAVRKITFLQELHTILGKYDRLREDNNHDVGCMDLLEKQ